MIHRAAKLVGGVQRCALCAYVLTDYRGWDIGTKAARGKLKGWPEGASVEVEEGNPRRSSVTDKPADCVVENLENGQGPRE
jgi:hypothetical protein